MPPRPDEGIVQGEAPALRGRHLAVGGPSDPEKRPATTASVQSPSQHIKG